MTVLTDVILLITWLFTNQINDMTQKDFIDFIMILCLLLKNSQFDSTVATACIAT